MRSKADYNVMHLPEREEAEEALEIAENFLERAGAGGRMVVGKA